MSCAASCKQVGINFGDDHTCPSQQVSSPLCSDDIQAQPVCKDAVDIIAVVAARRVPSTSRRESCTWRSEITTFGGTETSRMRGSVWMEISRAQHGYESLCSVHRFRALSDLTPGCAASIPSVAVNKKSWGTFIDASCRARRPSWQFSIPSVCSALPNNGQLGRFPPASAQQNPLSCLVSSSPPLSTLPNSRPPEGRHTSLATGHAEDNSVVISPSTPRPPHAFDNSLAYYPYLPDNPVAL